jgi:hypothetical protein
MIEMSNFIEGDTVQITGDGDFILVSRPGWVCDGAYPEPIDGINPNVHVLFQDGTEGVGYFSSFLHEWCIFPKEHEKMALKDYIWSSGSDISRIPVIGWKSPEPAEEIEANPWDRVWKMVNLPNSHCTLEEGPTIYLKETKPKVSPKPKRDIGDRVTSRQYGKGTIVKMDRIDHFLVVYDKAANGLWGGAALEDRCHWEEESTLE